MTARLSERQRRGQGKEAGAECDGDRMEIDGPGSGNIEARAARMLAAKAQLLACAELSPLLARNLKIVRRTWRLKHRCSGPIALDVIFSNNFSFNVCIC